MYEVMSGDNICMDGIILPLGTIHMQHWHLHLSFFLPLKFDLELGPKKTMMLI